MSGSYQPEADWVEMLKRLVQPDTDPRMERLPRYSTTDPDLIRLAPRVKGLLDI